MLAFLTASFLLVITPGPGVMTAAGVGAAFGFRAGLRYVLGLFFGSTLVALAVVTGVAALILANPTLRLIMFGVSTAYLLYLAYRIAFSGAHLGFGQASRPLGVIDGVVLQVFNPKAYVVNTTIFAGFVFWPDHFAAETVVKFLLFNAVWIPVHFAWLFAGSSVQQMNLSSKIQRRINICMALALLGVIALAGYSTLNA